MIYAVLVMACRSKEQTYREELTTIFLKWEEKMANGLITPLKVLTFVTVTMGRAYNNVTKLEGKCTLKVLTFVKSAVLISEALKAFFSPRQQFCLSCKVPHDGI